MSAIVDEKLEEGKKEDWRKKSGTYKFVQTPQKGTHGVHLKTLHSLSFLFFFCFHWNYNMLRLVINRPSHYTKQLWNSGRLQLITIRPFSCTSSIHQANNVNSPDTKKIYALPFKLSPERAPQVVELANYITEHKILGLFKLIKSVSTSRNDA